MKDEKVRRKWGASFTVSVMLLLISGAGANPPHWRGNASTEGAGAAVASSVGT
jgi:hypothetical protein